MRITKNVFLDSSAIVAQNLDFSSPSLNRLAGLALVDEVNLLTTSIVVREVESKFRERIVAARADFARLVAKHTVLKVSSNEIQRAALKSIDDEAEQRAFGGRFRRFREDTSTIELPITSDLIADILDGYFEGRPPFWRGQQESGICGRV